MSAVATKQKRPRKADSAKNTHKTTHRAISEIEADIAKARAKLDGLSSWQGEQRDRAAAQLEQLTAERETVELASMSVAESFTFKVQERDIDIAAIQITGNHREGDADGVETQRLARSLQVVGLQQRIGVRDQGGGSFELIFGSRRLRAAKLSDWKQIPAKIYPKDTTPYQVELLRDIENFNRKDLTPVERAIAVARTIDTVEKMAVPKTPEGRKLIAQIEAAGGRDAYIGQLLGYAAAWVRDHAYVSRLGGKARQLLAQRRITIEHARELAKLGDHRNADQHADWCAKNSDGTGGESVVWLRARVAEQLLSLKSVPWRLDVTFPKKGACLGVACDVCQFNSKSDPKLFEHDAAAPGEDPAGLSAAGVCRNQPCYQAKKSITEDAIADGLKKVAGVVKKSDDAIPLTEKGLAEFIPVTVRGATFARKAKATIDSETGKQAAPKVRGGQRYQERKKSPEEIARDRYEVSVDEWQTKASKKITKKIDADPMRRVYFQLLDSAGVLGNLRHHNGTNTYGDESYRQKQRQQADQNNAKARKLVTAGALKSIVKRIGEPKLSDFVALGKQLRGINTYEVRRLIDAGMLAFAAAVGVELDDAPQLETFLKEEQAKAKDAPATDARPAPDRGGDDGDGDDAEDLDDEE